MDCLLNTNVDYSAICKLTLPETTKVAQTTDQMHSRSMSLHVPAIWCKPLGIASLTTQHPDQCVKS